MSKYQQIFKDFQALSYEVKEKIVSNFLETETVEELKEWRNRINNLIDDKFAFGDGCFIND